MFRMLAGELADERLGLLPKQANIFRKKSYYSRDRGSAITTDISIELFRVDSDRPFLIWLIECKDYAQSVPVNDVEEFHAKLKQIGEDNTKGTLVTTSALQRGALAFARSKGIGVVRILPGDQMQHILEWSTVPPTSLVWTELEQALLSPCYRSTKSFFANQDNRWFDSWFSLIKHEVSSRQ